MRVLVMPADLGGCGNYRLIMAAEHLQSLGHDIHIQKPGDGATGFDVYLDDDGMITDFKLPIDDVDVLVMQRVSHDKHREVIPLIRERGIAVVIDMDDDLSSIHPSNVAFWNYRTHSLTPFSAKNAEFVCNAATLVTVSTKNLLRVYARHGRGQVIDNYVPERYLYVYGMPAEAPRFGWAGTLQSHPTDCQVVGRAVRNLVDAGFQLQVVGPADAKLKTTFKLAQDPPTTGIIPMFNWPEAIANNLDVGLAPLEPGTFNTSKSRLKLLEYCSVGVPYVASSRAEYVRLNQTARAGFLAETPKEWEKFTKQLLTDDVLRKELGEKGRAFAATQTIELNSWRWLEAWERAYKIQRGLE
jgi:Glycosyl transferases group 1